MIEHPHSVVLVVEDGSDVVLVRQHRPGAGVAVLELPAGKIEPGESPREAADRELAEECGLAVEEWLEIGHFWAAPAYSTEFVHVLAGARSGTAQRDADADEEIEVVRMPREHALASLEDAGSVAALGLWMRDFR